MTESDKNQLEENKKQFVLTDFFDKKSKKVSHD